MILLEVADKYKVISLKELCFSELGMNINESTAVDILLVSDEHVKGVYLRKRKLVMDYIKLNIAAIMKTSAWKENMLQCGDLTNEILSLFCV